MMTSKIIVDCYPVSDPALNLIIKIPNLTPTIPGNFRLTQAPEQQFKVVSQYFIHLVVEGPSFAPQANARYFKEALDAFRRRLKGTKDSLVTSSVWKTNFKKSLEAYPEFGLDDLDEPFDGCEACHMNRISKYVIEMGGPRYDKLTFEVRPDAVEP